VTTVEEDRDRLLSRYPMANTIHTFSKGESCELEIVYAAGMTVDGVRFADAKAQPMNPDSMYHHVYDMAKRGHWLRDTVWIAKRGTSVWLFDSPESRDAKKAEWKEQDRR
jgi:hypothetical protein